MVKLKRSPAFVMVVTVSVIVVGLSSVGTGSASATTTAGALVKDPGALVNPFAGTGAAPVKPGNVGEFPSADLPFGMIQWSPDTTPDRTDGSGYSYADSHISGFSLTHMSGTGCASYGDVPILPTVGPIGADPAGARDSFSHAHEQTSPGRYAVTLGPSKITSELAVTLRTGLARFDFPGTTSANLLFKVSDSANGVTGSNYQVTGDDVVSGDVTSGQFCDTGTPYTLYFTARFNRAFSTAGGWNGSTVTPGQRSCTGTACGAFVSFDTKTDRVVLMKVGISFVSIRDATENLTDEDPGWSLGSVEAASRQKWNSLLGRIRIGGGSHAHQRTFYTRPLPLAAAPQRRERRQRRLRGFRRPGCTGPRAGCSTPTSPSGTSTGRRSSSLALARPAAGRRHDPVAGQRRPTGRLAAEVGHRRWRRLSDER